MSTTLARVCRATSAAPPAASVTTGSARCSAHCAGSSPNDTYPVVGKSPRSAPRNVTSTRPSQKFGIAMPTELPSRAMRSNHPPCRTAASTPMTSPATIETTSDDTTSDMVMPIRSVIACVTG